MKKILISLLVLVFASVSANAATTWSAKDRVPVVGQQVLTKNKINTKITFNVVEGAADNSNAAKTNVINISTDDLQYAGNDNEVAAVVAHQLGHIICCHADKAKVVDLIMNGSNKTDAASKDATANLAGDIISAKVSQKEEEEADITAVSLMIPAGYNPLALIVWVTKQPGSAMDVIKGRPNNFDRALVSYKFLTYAYPSKVSVGYGCQEYRNFLAAADPIMKKLTKSKRRLNKFNKEQARLIQQRQIDLARYQTNGGLNSWGVTYDWLTNTEADKKEEAKTGTESK